jgi:1,4-dihydroxy-2-naphthoate octaprenyltransferase
MEWRPHPFGNNVGFGTRIEHRMNKRSNITIEIVKMVAFIGGGGAWKRIAKGWFLEFRLIPVLLWSYTAVVLGTALASADLGGFDPLWFGVALGLGALIQGWETHAINEIYDWRSGTDQIDGPRALSGGSRVRNLALLAEKDLWLIFAVSTVAVAALTAWVVLARGAWLALLIVTGYVLGVAYTVPPIATAYRPLAGEWLGGFPGVLLSGLGAYAIQTRTISVVAILALSAHALVCMGMLVVHHYLDAPMDAAARPPKRTTVVALGLRNSMRYASGMAFVATILYALLGYFDRPAFFLGAAFTAPAIWIHRRIDPTDLNSVTRNELRIIQLGIAAGLTTAVALAPALWPMLPLAALAYLVHLAVVSPPAALARAWRRAPAPSERR